MDDQVNDQVQAVHPDIKDLKEHMTKILELLTVRREKGLAEISSHVEIGLNQTDDTFAFPLGFTPKMISTQTWRKDLRGSREQKKTRVLEERLRPIEGANVYEDVNVSRLCLIADVDSLIGPTSCWYMHLLGSQVHGWEDLADAFLK
ncbi:dynactin subunit 1-like [Cucumis melo var. makuwa]|uniref:Dynactin subunit 1-like n=1 Tax=Cucumis melo var. makuwa TaxID=1194695 RepID=A0A5D3D760_CUCMM|nr:dynactin subunit 1-like [Cucumis melo var. makuwa]